MALQSSFFLLSGLYLVYHFTALWLEYRRKCHFFRDLPGYRTWFPAGGKEAAIFAPIYSMLGCLGRRLLFVNKRIMYEQSGWDVHSEVSLLPSVGTRIFVADAEVAKAIGADRVLFPKPIHLYKILSVFGKNIVASEGAPWKKYRKVSSPAFSSRNNRLVWAESLALVQSMIDDKSDWKGRDVVETNNPLSFTVPIALSILSGAGFGQPMRFSNSGYIPDGHNMTFHTALKIASGTIFFKAFFPKWFPAFTKRMKDSRNAFNELETYMREMIIERSSAAARQDRFDLFSGLLDSNEGREPEMQLSEEELIGNIFIFLIAGHETTAHTLAYTFGLLALYQKEQDLLYAQIKEVCRDGEEPSYEDIPKLSRSLAVFLETLRMFPSPVAIPKVASEDTTIVTKNPNGDARTIFVPKGMDISIHTLGLHYNPRYWKDPYTFDPSRFLQPDWPRDAFVPFSIGHRSCSGRSFSETEAIGIITALMLRYKVDLQDSFVERTRHMSAQERHDALFVTENILTLHPTSLPLRFTKR